MKAATAGTDCGIMSAPERCSAVTQAPTHPASRPVVIAIDGPAGAGKSTIARLLAARLGVPYLDTGAMYRAVGLLALRAGIRPPFDDRAEARLGELAGEHRIEVNGDAEGARVVVDGEDVSAEIRSPECSQMASAVSAVSAVRRSLVPLQRGEAAVRGGVLEGRDIGSVVVPEAHLKIFLTASATERAERRRLDLERRGVDVPLEEIRDEQARRDLQDSSRADSPLQVARGSVVIDTSSMSPEEVVERIVAELPATARSALDTPARTP